MLVVEAACFMVIAGIQVTVNLLHMQPGRWGLVAGNAWAALADRTFAPRYLHFLLAAVAMAGALAAFVAVRRAGKGGDAAACRGMARFGIRAALVATLLQLMDGFWLLLALPEEVLRSFMRGGAATMAPLGVGIMAGVLLLVVLAGISDPLTQPARVRHVAELVVGAMIFMIVTRHQLRAFYLASSTGRGAGGRGASDRAARAVPRRVRAVHRADGLGARAGRQGPPGAGRTRRVGGRPGLVKGKREDVKWETGVVFRFPSSLSVFTLDF